MEGTGGSGASVVPPSGAEAAAAHGIERGGELALLLEYDLKQHRLLDRREVLLLIAAWVVAWLVGHHFFWACWRSNRFSKLAFHPNPLERYRRRLCRSQVYCVLASIGGLHLLSQCRWGPEDLLHLFTVEHQVLFAMACGHWAVAIWEDLRSWEFLRSGLRVKDMPEMPDPSLFLLRAYALHHAVAGAGFAALLLTRAAPAIGAFGLIYEIPVLLMNHREFAVCAEETPVWFRMERQLKRFWFMLLSLFTAARGSATLVYVYSLCMWWDDLQALDFRESLLYHGLAIFFSLLNLVLKNTFLMAWKLRDEAAAKDSYDDNLELEGLQETGSVTANGIGSHQQEPVVDERVPKLLKVTPKLLEERTGEEGKDLWVEIDGAAYDVTAFASQHPGGEAVLRQHGGKDATEAFRRARHSAKATREMQRYAVGPVVRPPTKYRIFEHDEAMADTLMEATSCVTVYSVAVLALGMVPLRQHLSSLADRPLLLFIVPGLLQSLVAGACLLLWLLASGRFSCVRVGPEALGLGLCHIGIFASLILARSPLPSGVDGACPGGLELGAVALLVWEEAIELLSAPRGLLSSAAAYGGQGCAPGSDGDAGLMAVVCFAAVLVSWGSRDLAGLAAQEPERLIAAFIVFPACAAWMVRQIKAGLARERIVANLVGGAVLSSVLSAVGLLACAAIDAPHMQQVVQMARELPWREKGQLALAGACNMGASLLIMNAAFLCSPVWCSRLMAINLLVGVILTGGLLSCRWLVLLAFLKHMFTIGGRLKRKLQAVGDTGRFGEVQPYVIGTVAFWDQIRVAACTLIWRMLSNFFSQLANFVVPQELCFYACPIPMFDLGDKADIGVAAHFAPKQSPGRRRGAAPAVNGGGGAASEGGTASAGSAEVPGQANYVVCNVGHISNEHNSGLRDLQRTLNTLRDVWHEFADPEMRGLVANVVAVFPNLMGHRCAKELNLSAWESGAAAHEWYTKSKGHQDVMTQHTGGALVTFGNLLASLVPVGKLRHQDRCTRCSRLAEGEPGTHAPAYCQFCGAKTFGYPMF